jgi:hypothetical protein
MIRTAIHFVIGLAIFFCAAAAAGGFLFQRQVMHEQLGAVDRPQDVGRLPLQGPAAEWERSFFKALEQRTGRINLPSLRTIILSNDDLEIRFWYNASPDIINGFAIRRSGKQWTAIGIRQIGERQDSPVRQEALGTPKSGWEVAWKRLVDAGILTLPDGSKVKCRAEVLDGAGFVVETNANGIYRTYHYSNPQFADCDEAKRIMLIEEIIADEFGLHASEK